MREILFRGKQAGNGEWIFGSIVHQTDYYGDRCDCWFILEGDSTNDYDIDYPIEVQKETVGQYTGLKDKNGNKIFEGDVIRDEDGDVMVVKWLTESAAFVLEPKPYASIYFYGTLSSRIEIIGNIYDNPELMGGEANG